MDNNALKIASAMAEKSNASVLELVKPMDNSIKVWVAVQISTNLILYWTMAEHPDTAKKRLQTQYSWNRNRFAIRPYSLTPIQEEQS